MLAHPHPRLLRGVSCTHTLRCALSILFSPGPSRAPAACTPRACGIADRMLAATRGGYCSSRPTRARPGFAGPSPPRLRSYSDSSRRHGGRRALVPRAAAAVGRAAPTATTPAPAAAAPPTTTATTTGRVFMLAVDESQDSKYAVEWALQNLCAAGDRLQLVHVIPLLPWGTAGLLPRGAPALHPSLVAAAAQQQWEQHIGSDVAAPIEAAGVSWSLQLLHEPVPGAEGRAVRSAVGDLLAAAAQQHGAAAVVAASAAPGGLREWIRGSVTHRLTQTARVPVVVLHRPQQQQQREQQREQQRQGGRRSPSRPWWLAATIDAGDGDAPAASDGGQAAPAPAPAPPRASGPSCVCARRWLVGVDDTLDSERAVAWVLSTLWRPRDTLVLLHVVPGTPVAAPYSLAPDGLLYTVPLPTAEETQAEEAAWRAALLRRFVPLLEARGAGYEVEVVGAGGGGDPLEAVAAAVVGAAERLGGDALVLSGHGRAAWEQWLLGSVTSYAARRSARPVVVLHAGGGGSSSCGAAD